MKTHAEQAFESIIEEHLLSPAGGGYDRGDARDYDAAAAPEGYDRERALFPGVFAAFVRASQPKAWEALEKLHGAEAADVLLDELVKNLDSRGSLEVIRHGFKCYGKQVEAAFFRPSHCLNPETRALYEANRLTVTRQVHYSAGGEQSIDLLIALNGLPIVTAELKNPMSGQTVADAKRQYRQDRDPREPIFQFKRRTLVHFAVDPDLVFMTTQLKGGETFFLPFNRGAGNAAGNPENPTSASGGGGHRTAYLWEEVWQRDSMLDIVGRFLHLQVEERRVPTKGGGSKRVRREKMIFPRYHQLDCVRRLEAHAREHGAGRSYLIQHSAGSGKSNSIGWLAHRLSTLHDGQDGKVFHSVIVVTDRVVLDQQLQDTIYQFEHVHGVVQKIEKDTAQLTRALREGVPIIITTIQKFPFVAAQLEKQAEEEAKGKGSAAAGGVALPPRKYAVIVDEAHSSQSGEMARELKGVLAGERIAEEAKERAEAEKLEDWEEMLVRVMLERGRQQDLSFFAFTATPKHKTLEVFGERGPDGKPAPFHLYSMRQAIEEGFILDVLKNYTTYKTYFGLVKSAADDPNVKKRQAARALARFMTLHPHNIAQKTELMVEHFQHFIRGKIGGKAKAMVVTSSRLHAVRYKQAFDKYIAEKKYPIRSLVAFSGTVTDDLDSSLTYTEGGMNDGIEGKALPERFATDEFRVLLVAEKFQTGFDQPLLHTMYVDKKLDGVHAVQTLSRLNRTHPGKEDTFVLDFVNDRDEIFEAFQPYYEATGVGEEADPHQLYTLQGELSAFGVLRPEEIEAFCRVFFRPRAIQSARDHAEMNAAIDPAVSRFEALADEKRPMLTAEEWEREKEEAQEGFRGKLQAFRSLYSFLSQIIPFQDPDLEKLYVYGRFLLAKLPKRKRGPQYHFEDDVALKYYRLQKISEGAIPLQPDLGGDVPGPTSRGTGVVRDEEIELSRLIDLLNDRFGTEFKPADQLFLDSVLEEALADESLREAALANTIENFRFVFSKALEGLFIDRMEQNEDIFARFMGDPQFQQVVEESLRRQMYERVRKGEPQGAGQESTD